MADLYSSGLKRIPSTTTAATITGPFSSNSTYLVTLGSSKPKTPRYRGVTIQFSANADNATGAFALWGRHTYQLSDTESTTAGCVISLGTGTFTAGTPTSSVISNQYLADTITFTASTFLTNLLGSVSASSLTHSPADNTPALLRIEDLGNMDLYCDVWCTSSTTAVSAWVETNI